MGRAIGPIVTTGAAIVAAGLVVANPVIPQRGDLRIPSVNLASGSDPVAEMLDASFLDAIAPGPTESAGPLSVLKQLITALAGDPSYVSRSAIVDAFLAGIRVVSGPDPAATVDLQPLTPFAPPPAVAGLDPTDLAALFPSIPVDDVVDPMGFIGDSVVPAFGELVSAVADDAGYLSDEIISAALAVGAAVIAEPAVVSAALTALISGDVSGAVDGAIEIVISPLKPSLKVINAIITVIEKRLPGVHVDIAPAPVDVPVPQPAAERDRLAADVRLGDLRARTLPVVLSAPAASGVRTAASVNRSGVAQGVRDAGATLGGQLRTAVHSAAATAAKAGARATGATSAR